MTAAARLEDGMGALTAAGMHGAAPAAVNAGGTVCDPIRRQQR